MKKIHFKSLRVFLSSVVAAIIIVGIAVLISLSYNAAYNAVENSYLNQIGNFNSSLNEQMKDFFTDQLKSAAFLAKNRMIIEAMDTGNYAAANGMLNSFYTEKGIYEDVIMSTMEKNPEVKSAGSIKAIGIRWGNIGYDDNISAAYKGESHISRINKSPATGLPVILVTAPIKKGERPIGILGLSVNIGTISNSMVKDIKIGKTGYPYMTTLEGITFAHPVEKNIFNLKLAEHEWGRELLGKPSDSIIRYVWEGKDKIQVAKKDEKFKFISIITMYVSDINDEARSMAAKMIIFGIITIIAAAAGIYLLISKRLRPLEGCKDVMNGMARGDLSLRYNGRLYEDEVGEIASSMNNSMEQFERLISEIIVASQNLAQAVEQIATGNQNLSQRTSEQASSLEEIASTVEEATAAIKQNAENASEVNKMSEESMRIADEGNSIAKEAVASINEISESGKKIGEIISVINEIAFQTNLLALNAAVEAARAGEQGRGFAVVAGEVRNLAQRAGTASKEIEELIKSSLDKVEKGTDLVGKSSEALLDVIKSVKKVGQLISEIAASSEEQRQGIDQINLAVTEMDNMTQQNAALVEETASAGEEMANQAQELLSMMDRFSINDSTKSEIYNKKHREIHLSGAGDGNGNGNGRDKKSLEVKHSVAGIKDVKEVLAGEGFEEF